MSIEERFRLLLDSPSIDLKQLSRLAWGGIPSSIRPTVWKLLIGLLPRVREHWMSQMERKHIEYLGIVKQHFGPGSIQNASIMHQIKIDVPRTAPSTPLFREALVRESLERILYCVSIRRPASSYVQGMNDLLTPIYSVLFSEYLFELADSRKGHGKESRSNPDSPTLKTKSSDEKTDDANENLNEISNSFIASVESNFQLPLDQKKNHQGLMIDLKNFKGLLFDMKVCECIPVCLNVCKKAFSQRNSMDSKVYDKILIKYKAHSMDTTAEPDEYESTKSFGNFTQVFVPANKLYMIEAEAFWFLGRLLDSVQDNYTPSQTGIARQISIMIKVLGRTNPRLMSHLRALHVEPLQYAFRWMNCMLIREFPLHTVIRLWDSYLGESEESFCEFHIYVCVAFLAHWEPVILEMHDFNDVIIFLQAPPTQNWTNGDLEILLSQAYVWKAMFSDR